MGGSLERDSVEEAISKAQNSNANTQTALNFCADSRSAPRRACHPGSLMAAHNKRQNAPLRRLSAYERAQFERNVQRFSEEAAAMADAEDLTPEEAADEAAWADLTHFRHQQLSAAVYFLAHASSCTCTAVRCAGWCDALGCAIALSHRATGYSHMRSRSRVWQLSQISLLVSLQLPAQTCSWYGKYLWEVIKDSGF